MIQRHAARKALAARKGLHAHHLGQVPERAQSLAAAGGHEAAAHGKVERKARTRVRDQRLPREQRGRVEKDDLALPGRHDEVCAAAIETDLGQLRRA